MAQDIQSAALAPTANDNLPSLQNLSGTANPGGGNGALPTTGGLIQPGSITQTPANASQPGSGLIQPGSNTTQLGSPPVAGTPEKTPANNGTGFVNLQQYLNANQGNQLGSAVSGTINNATNATNTDLSGQQAAFGTGLQQARSGTIQDQQNVAGIMQDINSSNFSGLTAPQIQSYQQEQSTPYQGPTGYSNVQQLQQQAAQAQALGQLAGSSTGRQQLLQQTITNPNYTNAESNMDQLFLSLGGGNQAVQNAAQGTQQLAGNIQGQIATAQAQGNAAQNAYTNQQQAAAQGVTSQNNATNAAIAAAVKNAQNYQTGTVQPLQAALNSNTITPAQAAQLGGLPLGENTFNVNPGSYFTAGITPTAANVATSQQQAQLTALAQLAGNQVPTFDTTQTNTYNTTNPYTFNSTGFQNAVNAQQQAYQQALNGTEAANQAWIAQQNAAQKAQANGGLYVDVSPAQAQANLTQLVNAVRAQYPGWNTELGNPNPDT